MEKFLNEFIKNLRATFGERLSSVFLYGSCAVEDCSRTFSDINLMVIIKDLRALDLKNAHKFSEKYTKGAKYLPIFMDKEEWLNSCDVYPIEYSDIKARHKIVHGENLIEGLNIEKKYLRLQCEQETKNLLIRLRQTYLAKSTDTKSIKNLIKTSSKTFVVIFRTILRLSDIDVPTTHFDVVGCFAEKIKSNAIEFDKELFEKILEFRKDERVIKNSELDSVIEKMIDTTNSVLKYVDKLEI